jgi:hypothetical protein
MGPLVSSSIAKTAIELTRTVGALVAVVSYQLSPQTPYVVGSVSMVHTTCNCAEGRSYPKVLTCSMLLLG